MKFSQIALKQTRQKYLFYLTAPTKTLKFRTVDWYHSADSRTVSSSLPTKRPRHHKFCSYMFQTSAKPKSKVLLCANNFSPNSFSNSFRVPVSVPFTDLYICCDKNDWNLAGQVVVIPRSSFVNIPVKYDVQDQRKQISCLVLYFFVYFINLVFSFCDVRVDLWSWLPVVNEQLTITSNFWKYSRWALETKQRNTNLVCHSDNTSPALRGW